jgi:hypothetical protein
MDEVTQQNAALVEQAAAAASSLEEQARRLTTAVAVFRTDSGQASASRVAARRVVSQKQGVAMQMEAVEAV